MSDESQENEYYIVGRLLARRYMCCVCSDLRAGALKKLNEGPQAVIDVFANYNGVLCGHAEWAKYYAIEWNTRHNKDGE